MRSILLLLSGWHCASSDDYLQSWAARSGQDLEYHDVYPPSSDGCFLLPAVCRKSGLEGWPEHFDITSPNIFGSRYCSVCKRHKPRPEFLGNHECNPCGAVSLTGSDGYFLYGGPSHEQFDAGTYTGEMMDRFWYYYGQRQQRRYQRRNIIDDEAEIEMEFDTLIRRHYTAKTRHKDIRNLNRKLSLIVVGGLLGNAETARGKKVGAVFWKTNKKAGGDGMDNFGHYAKYLRNLVGHWCMASESCETKEFTPREKIILKYLYRKSPLWREIAEAFRQIDGD